MQSIKHEDKVFGNNLLGLRHLSITNHTRSGTSYDFKYACVIYSFEWDTDGLESASKNKKHDICHFC